MKPGPAQWNPKRSAGETPRLPPPGSGPKPRGPGCCLPCPAVPHGCSRSFALPWRTPPGWPPFLPFGQPPSASPVGSKSRWDRVSIPCDRRARCASARPSAEFLPGPPEPHRRTGQSHLHPVSGWSFFFLHNRAALVEKLKVVGGLHGRPVTVITSCGLGKANTIIPAPKSGAAGMPRVWVVRPCTGNGAGRAIAS